MLPEKLPKLTMPGDALSEKDWEYYFECRKKFDRYVSPEEKRKIFLKSTTIDFKDDAFNKVVKVYPIKPALALAIKSCQGLMALCDFNLYEAKQAFPGEF